MSKITNMKFIYILVLASVINLQAIAQTIKGYTLFKPVPRDSLREFSLDRPDVTESPQTVDAGHFQFEGDIVKWQKESRDAKGMLLLWSGLYKMGLTENWDFHLGYELHNINPDNEGVKSKNGHGGLTLRLKRNFWGNNGDTKTALGAIPYVTFISGKPFDADEEIQFGVGFPFSSSINETLGWGAQPQIDFVPNGEGGHDVSFFQTVVLGGSLIGALDFYIEGLGIFNAKENKYLANGGLIYSINPNIKVDVATNIGLNKSAPTRLYFGLSFRI